jgi:hypothetical protein
MSTIGRKPLHRKDVLTVCIIRDMDRSDDGGSKHLRNNAKFLLDYTSPHPRRQWYSCLSPWQTGVSPEFFLNSQCIVEYVYVHMFVTTVLTLCTWWQHPINFMAPSLCWEDECHNRFCLTGRLCPTIWKTRDTSDLLLTLDIKQFSLKFS